ncbi:hypothetical protein [Marivita sp.]|uniref:hypothetical protein n=1 Tax=Marivita sp. TaxID=2003365 RepID=UPI0025C44ADE|nr:hypothetical protein [Marivita sp.]
MERFSEFEQIPKKYESEMDGFPSLLVPALFVVFVPLGLLFWIYLLGRLLVWVF